MDLLGPRASFTIDFGDVLHTRILDTSKSLGKTKSELVRDATQYYLDGMCYNVLNKDKKEKKEPKNQVKISKREEVFKIVEEYNTIFYGTSDPPNQFYPALFKVYNAAVKGGLSMLDMIKLVHVAPNETFVAQDMRQGKTPSLPYLLSQGMIPRLMVVLRDSEKHDEKLSEADFIEYQYDVLEQNINDVLSKEIDSFRDDIMAATNKSDIKKVLRVYIR